MIRLGMLGFIFNRKEVGFPHEDLKIIYTQKKLLYNNIVCNFIDQVIWSSK